MAMVEKDGMKLYDKLGLIGGGESVRLQETMEDFGTPGTYIPENSFETHQLYDMDLRSHTLNCLRTNHI